MLDLQSKLEMRLRYLRLMSEIPYAEVGDQVQALLVVDLEEDQLEVHGQHLDVVGPGVEHQEARI